MALLLCACVAQKPEDVETPPPTQSAPLPHEQKEQLPPKTQAKIMSMFEIADIELIYLGMKDGYCFLLALHEEQQVYRVLDEGNTLVDVPQFSQLSISTDSYDGSPFLSFCQSPNGKVPIVQAINFEAAGQIYPGEMLAFLRNSLFWYAYSLEDFTVHTVETERINDYVEKVTFTWDIEPSYSAFDDNLGYFWSRGKKDATILGQQSSFYLYGFDGQYACDPMDPLFLEEGAYPPEKEPLYEIPVYEGQAIQEGREEQDIIYEEYPYSYIMGSRLVGEENEEQFFSSTVYRIDVQNQNQQTILAENLPQGLVYLIPFAKNADTLYCTSIYAEPYSEGSDGQVFSIDLVSGEVQEILPASSSILGSKGDWFYFTVMPNDEQTEGLYRLNIANGEANKLAQLPAPRYSTAYYSSYINYIDGNDIYLSWPRDTGFLEEYFLFRLDSRRGTFLLIE